MDQTPETTPEEKPKRIAHTYEDDMARAMDATDVHVVQELLENAREREAVMKDEVVKRHQRVWYTTGAIILILLAVGAAGYGVYHYMQLTVPAQKSISVGVFPSTEIISAESTDIKTVLETVLATPLPEGKPHLITLVSNEASRTLLSRTEFFSFIEADATEPFIASVDTIRLGALNTGREVLPFIIASVPDPEIASKEFLIAEADLLEMLKKALAIDTTQYVNETGSGFTGEYMYNLPVRTLRNTDLATNQQRSMLLYAYTTDNTVVFATKPEVLKAIYDTIIRQR